MKAKCVVCGKEFEKLGPSQACASECRAKLRREYLRKWERKQYEANSEKKLKHNRTYYAINRQKIIEKRRKLYADNRRHAKRPFAKCMVCGKPFEQRHTSKTCGKECSLKFKNQRQRERRRANPDKTRELRRKSWLANLDRNRKRNRKWKAANPEKVRDLFRKWKAANPEKYQECNRKPRTRNPEERRKAFTKYNRFVRAAKKLGISPLIYAAMKMDDRVTQLQEQSSDRDHDQPR